MRAPLASVGGTLTFRELRATFHGWQSLVSMKLANKTEARTLFWLQVALQCQGACALRRDRGRNYMTKKTFTFRYAPQAESVSRRLLRAVKTKKPEVHPDEMECSSLKTLLEIATESRLKIMETIIQENPSSLYELSKQLEIDQAYVMREAKILEALGLIRLVADKSDGREKLRPAALYENIVIDCGLSDRVSA